MDWMWSSLQIIRLTGKMLALALKASLSADTLLAVP